MSLLLALTGSGPTNYAVNADAGSYAVNGQSATVAKSTSVVALAGAYQVSGQAAIITYTPGAGAYTITAEVGAYVVSGQPATISYVPGASSGKSGVNRLWLIDYYTKEWAKRDAPTAVDTEAVATPALKRKATIARKRKVAELVDKAEADIAKLTRGVESAVAAQQFTLQLLAYAQQLPEPEIDFMSIADGYRKKRNREDDELLLLAMVI